MPLRKSIRLLGPPLYGTTSIACTTYSARLGDVLYHCLYYTYITLATIAKLFFSCIKYFKAFQRRSRSTWTHVWKVNIDHKKAWINLHIAAMTTHSVSSLLIICLKYFEIHLTFTSKISFSFQLSNPNLLSLVNQN